MRLGHTTIGATRLARPLTTATMALLLLTLGGTAASAAAPASSVRQENPSPTAVAINAFAWVVARHPLKLHYTPAASDRGNSEGGINSVERVDIGVYRVNLPKFYDANGVVQVTPLGNAANRCVASDWEVGTDHLQIFITCSNASGVEAPSAFSMSYISYSASHTGSRELAYLLADQPSAASYTPIANDNFNSSGPFSVYNTVQRNAVGQYTARLPNLGSTRGHVQVVAVQLFGATVACHLLAWAPQGTTMLVDVLCRDEAGDPADTYFALTFVKSLELTGYSASKGAYLFADQRTSASYHPAKRYRYSSAGTVPTVKRSGKGRYSVVLPGMPSGGAAHVTPYGPGKTRCNLSSIRASGSPQTVGVRCYDLAGHPADSLFTLAYVH